MASVDLVSVLKQLTDTGVPFKSAFDPDWAEYSTPYNIRLPFTPAVIVIPQALWQIESALACAREHGLKVQARSGGHSYASHSIGGVDGAMVMDMRRFQYKDTGGDPVVVDTGVRIGNIAKAIYEDFDQKRALPHGTCAGVGLGGHLTHGGFGMFSRAWGLAMDRIEGMKVITADGKCIFCDQNENGDLFYAMRGAGDSFGIVKSFYLDPVPAPESVLHWAVNINDVTKSIKSAVNAFRHIQKFVHDASVVDRQLGLQISLSWDHFSVDGTYLGPRETLENEILPALMGKIPEEKRSLVTEYDWLASIKSFNQGQDIVTDESVVYREHVNFFAKSVVVPEPGFTLKAMQSFFEFLFNEGSRAPIGYFILFDLYGGNDSQINKKDIDFSAFAHRDACWVIQLHGFVNNDIVFPQEGIEFIQGLADSITSNLKKCGAYSNYTDPSLTREEAHKLYFGDTSKILWKLKKKWDPDNLFANPQSILPD
ncbi:putative glucooligosaccharide oxidase [Annulohypoxylon truncatum]|uniref:putative glucooligosaccharide oxidase n=1 Tax=Annulohypoxylon truncatum TaxID=327061 RepID=UPI00200796A9|nr:putative glucooligosaccharide oxidase [Annulohypoxylon truncatum]KAI1207459.1 putative glucooligosaccharide oxidase [Annulohypoxylon truncatum]